MRKLFCLWKLNFRSMLYAFAGRSRKQTAGGFGALALMAFLALYCSGAYSFLLADILGGTGALDLLLPLMAILGCVMALFLTVMATSGLVFGGRDSDLMLTLPVPAFYVVLGKLLALYFENLLFCGMWMLPTSAAYLMKAAPGALGGALFCVRLLLTLPFLPLAPSTLALLGGWLVAYAAGRMKHKSLVTTVLSIALAAAIMAGSMRINGLAAALLTHAESVRRVLHRGLLPFGLLLDGLTGSVPALIGFILLCLVPFLALAWLVGTRYRRILSAIGSHRTRGDYKLREVKTAGAFAALFKKECRRLFGSTLYLLNTCIGAVFLLGFAVYALAARDSVLTVTGMLGGVESALPLFAAMLCLMQSTVDVTSVSVSLEGKTLWILKEAPVAPRTLFGAKALPGVLMACVPGALSAVLAGVGLGISAAGTLALTALALGFGMLIAVFGLAINLRFPKLDWENEALVVKQSLSVFLAMFGGMALVGAGALLWLAARNFMAFPAFALAAALLSLLFAALLWRWVCRRGPEILKTL